MILKRFPQIFKHTQSNQILIRTSPTINRAHRFYSKNLLNIQNPKQFTSFHSHEKYNQIRFISNSIDKTISENVSSKYKELKENFKWRENPVIVTLDTPQFQSILQGSIRELVEIFEKYGYELRIAGGAVRDLLMNVTPADMDFATDATPEEMVRMFSKENIRTINKNGERFGTVTAYFNDEVSFQVTSLRIDIQTDGRYAEVEFTKDWLLDAHRRDFTVNSMFLGFDGKVYDYLYGEEDLKNRQIKFIGEPDKRIKEDYLRILRYFRFYGRVSSTPNNFDANIIKAICENIDGLKDINGVRIWAELRKTLLGNHRFEIFAKIIECGASKYIGLPASVDCNHLFRLKEILETTFKDVAIHPITIVSTLLNSVDDAIRLNEFIRPTAFDRDLNIFLAENKTATFDIDELFLYQKLCVPQKKLSSKTLKMFTLELLKYNGKRQIYDQLLNWQMPELPIQKANLTKLGYKKQKADLILDKLALIWADSQFKLSRDELLQQHLPTAAAKVTEELAIQDQKSKLKNVTATARQ